jgi:hypothetical protein
MPKFYSSISDDLAAWAMRQPVFFTASAPLTGRHVNISPKGIPSSTLSILSPASVAYVDATGSGCETIAHVYENARVTLMFCSFGATPRIMRFFCTGRVVEWDRPEFESLLERMGKMRIQGARAVILLDVFKVCRNKYVNINIYINTSSHPTLLPQESILTVWYQGPNKLRLRRPTHL